MPHGPVYDFFLNNWSSRCVLEIAWSTDVQSSATKLSEERAALLQKPFRTMHVNWTGVSQDEVERLTMSLARAADQRGYVPLYCDQVEVTGTSMDLLTVFGDTTGPRRFYVGQPVLVFEVDPITNRITRRAVMTVAAVLYDSLGSVTFTAPVDAAYPAFKSIVVPLIFVEIELASEIDMLTESKAQVAMSFHEVLRDGGIPAFTPPLNYVPYTSFPILYLEPNWTNAVRTRINRQGTKYQAGRSEIVFVESARVQFEHEYQLTFDSHAAAVSISTFFDNRKGRLLPFYAIAPNALWTPFTIVSDDGGGHGYIDVVPIPQANIEDVQDFIDFIALVDLDGTVFLATLTSCTVVAGKWRFLLPVTIPAGFTDLTKVRRFTRAHLVRFVEDSLTENWITSEICEMTVSVRDLVNEQIVEVDNPIQQPPQVIPFGGGVVPSGVYYSYTQVFADGSQSQESPVFITPVGAPRTNQVGTLEAAPPGAVQLKWWRSKGALVGGPRYLVHISGLPPVVWIDNNADGALGPAGPP